MEIAKVSQGGLSAADLDSKVRGLKKNSKKKKNIVEGIRKKLGISVGNILKIKNRTKNS